MTAVLVLVVAILGTGLPASAGVLAAGAPDPSFIAVRQVDAVVSAIDRDGGVLVLRTEIGHLRLEAVSAAVGVLEEGARVVLDVAVLRLPDPGRVPRAGTPERPLVMRRLPAVVTALQRTVGIVGLTTAVGRLDLDLPLTTVKSMRTGDRLYLELAVLRASDVPAAPEMDEGKRRRGLGALLLGIFGVGRGARQ